MLVDIMAAYVGKPLMQKPTSRPADVAGNEFGCLVLFIVRLNGGSSLFQCNGSKDLSTAK